MTEFSVLPQGARVRVRRGRYPMAPGLVGRTGRIVENSPYQPTKVSVALDGDPEIRVFSPDELELVSGPAALPEDRRAARARLSRP